MDCQNALITCVAKRRSGLLCLCLGWVVFVPISAGEVAKTGTGAAPSSLIAFANRVLDDHPRVRSAQAELSAALARERGAGRAIYNPELDAEYEDGEVRRHAIGFNQTIDLGDKRHARQRAASFETQRATESLAEVRQDVLTELFRALGMVDVASEQLRIAEERKALIDRLRVLSDERRQAGDLSEVELDLSRLAYAEAALVHSQAAVQEVAAKQALARVAGDGHSTYPSLPSAFIPVILSEEAVDDFLANLPMVRAAAARRAASETMVDLRRREQRPDPTVGVYAGREGDDDLLGLRVSIPLPIRNRFSAEVEAARAELDALDRLLANDYRKLRSDLIAAERRYEVARTAWEEWQSIGAGSLATRTQMLERLWRAGELNTTDYLVQLQQTLDTREAASEQRGVLWGAWIDWLAASGQVDDWIGTAARR